MSKEKIKVYLYTRVSTAMQIDGYLMEEQKSKMEAYTKEFIEQKQQDIINYIIGCWPGEQAEKFAKAIEYKR